MIDYNLQDQNISLEEYAQPVLFQAGTRFDKVLQFVSPIVKSYRSDLELDRELIDNNLGTEFILSARETGTHLIALTLHDDETWPDVGEKVPYLFGRAGRREILEGKTEIAEYVLKNPGKAIYHIKVGSFVKIQPSQVIGIVEDYTRKVLNVWNKQELNWRA